MSKTYDLVGLGIGPFHLSVAALANKLSQREILFLDKKEKFMWHSELLFKDAVMQTSWLKDLVTPVDPTNPNSFLNFLVEKGLFYAFMNTGRRVINRAEFEQYCQWVATKNSNLQFKTSVNSVSFEKDHFQIETSMGTYKAKNISVATGLVQQIPDFAKKVVGKNVFHAKSPELQSMDLREKRVLIIGGGQTGVEIFRNTLHGKWGRPRTLRLVSRRMNLLPLDESPFTNEFFTPSYVKEFFPLTNVQKDPIVASQKLASDGNTPTYLQALFEDLYQLKHVDQDPLDFKILPSRKVQSLESIVGGHRATIENHFNHSAEVIEADIVILATGFCTKTPDFMNPIRHLLEFSAGNLLSINQNFSLNWKGPDSNKIYALNFSRHQHGISEPQTSLMAWRAATILNDFSGKDIYKLNHEAPCFVQYGSQGL